MERDFKGVWIPKEIWLDSRLNALDKIILTEIDSLDKGDDGCWASNQYIADFCQCSIRKVSDSISKLIKLEYLYVKSFDGRIRNLKSRLANYSIQPSKICEADTQNLLVTNTSNKTKTNTKNNRFVPPTLEEVQAYCLERKNKVDAQRFIDYYSSNGWRVGRNQMKDWQAAVRTWERNSFAKSKVGANGVKLSDDPDTSLDDIF